MESYDGNETPLEQLLNKMSSFVCEHGPLLLTRGMPALEANEAIMACLEKLKAEMDTAHRRLIASEAAMKQLIEAPAHKCAVQFVEEVKNA